MQNWYCENEDCGACINEERYQCAGCFHWFCGACSRACDESRLRVCSSCWTIWNNVSRVFVSGGCVSCGKRREHPDALLCDACERALGSGAWGG
jgi:hypothetical protein